MNAKKTSRVTLSDVASAAGVGTATVDRVLNERGNVSAAVRRKVIRAAKELGLRRLLPSEQSRTPRVHVILTRVERPLLRRMADAAARIGKHTPGGPILHRSLLTTEDPARVAQAMRMPGYDAVIVVAQDAPAITQAIADLAAKGCPVVTVISDVPGSQRVAYAGIDHGKAGRTAAFFLAGMIAPGPALRRVVILSHDEGYQAHAQRIEGFTTHLAQDAPHLQVAEIVHGGDDALLSAAKLKQTFARHPDIAGIYNAGGANRGVVAAIEAGILTNPPLFIGHELTEFSERCLRNRVMTLAIDQNPELQLRKALDAVHVALQNHHCDGPPGLQMLEVPFILYSPHNLPSKDAPA